MTDEQIRALAAWLRNSNSDFAEACRSALQPAAVALCRAINEAAAHFAVFPDHHRRAIMRRKIRRVFA
jgi:hypothetical protein